MAKKKPTCYSGVGGQAVLEGVMMKNKEKYAIAVRKPDGEIEVALETFQGIWEEYKFIKLPFIRGIFNFIDSMRLGMKSLNYSASFYEEESGESEVDKNKIGKETMDKVMNVIVTILSVALAVGLFIVLPYFISSLLNDFIRNRSLLLILEGAVRILIFVLYVWGISAMNDIRRLYQYHGAEHKCINCIERGRELTVRNVMRSSRLHKRCGTSFMFFVLFVSIVVSFFITAENPLVKVGLRILLLPVIAGISFEIIRLAGRTNNVFVRLLSAPGMMIQRLSTKEPDREMVEVAIKAVEAVFDWRAYLGENFGYETEEELVVNLAGQQEDGEQQE